MILQFVKKAVDESQRKSKKPVLEQGEFPLNMKRNCSSLQQYSGLNKLPWKNEYINGNVKPGKPWMFYSGYAQIQA